MKNLPLENYPPLARKAVIFYRASQNSHEITNRTVGSEEVSYYLLSHALELAIKAVVFHKIEEEATWIHDKDELANKYQHICKFSKKEREVIHELKELNNGPGGLRYANEPQAEFLPSTFHDGSNIVERLLKEFE